ncbi:MAG: PilZ domain-containing protein [Polyangiaceae bacterium]|nr:PilZ domain-containing protein [Polyangiaceae bacterium]
MDQHERRNEQQRRVPLDALVELCGNEPGVPAFEARAVDVSGHGMQLRTAYLPDVGAPLVCRFDDQGREVIVEGVVAWRREEARGGEFGLSFTALDAGSVAALRELCGEDPPEEPAPPTRVAGTSVSEGARVRLHIDGLAAPMKARVRTGTDRKLAVGSTLEFLKVGRELDVEDLDGGQRRTARIETVGVQVDPTSGVPQLVVGLRLDGADATPEPTVLHSDGGEDDAPRPRRAAPVVAAVPAGAAATDESTEGADGCDEDGAEAVAGEESDDAFRGNVARAATVAGDAAKVAGAAMARAGTQAAAGLGWLFRGASERVMALRARGGAGTTARRTTAPAPASATAARTLRPQSTARAAAAAPPAPDAAQPRKKRLAVLGGAAVLLVGVGVLATRKTAPPPGEVAAAASVQIAADEVTEVDEQGTPVARAAAAKSLAPAASGGAVVADVPLFGPTPMATTEAAPLDPPVPAEEESAAEAEGAEPEPAAADESFPEEKVAARPTRKPEEVEPWGRGKLSTPTIHRIRLDGPGSAVQGAITPTGFAVVIPGRKTLEPGTGIMSRDKRIARVRTTNLPSGAQIAFSFRDGVPGYRVRLRRDYVEFLISAPAAKAEPASGAAKTGKAGAKRSKAR